MLLRNVHLPLGGPPGRWDVRVEGALVAAVGPLAPRPGEETVDADGRWLVPGLWDGHVHLGQWARRRTRLNLSGTADAAEALARVAAAVAAVPDGGLLVGSGQRPATWPSPPTVAALDAVSGEVPVVLVSGDAHAGWLNSAALARFGAGRRDDPLVEAEWFAVLPAVLAVEDAQVGPGAYAAALREAAGRGVTGVVDYEFEPGFEAWPGRFGAVGVGLRVRTSTYPADLDRVIAARLRTGDALAGPPGDPLVTMGSLKVITDGSLNTRTAHCAQPYPGGGHGVQNVPADELRELLAAARAHGLGAAVHAIGDEAASIALDAFAATGAAGSLEHAQLLPPGAPATLARLGLVASVQPAHLLDDRGVTERVWGQERASRSFPLRELADAGVRLVFGSDAPVAPLDPWLAMAAAVHRGDPGGPAWYPGHALTARQALAASTGGRDGVRAGGPADLALLDDDPLAGGDPSSVAARLRAMTVAATWVAGRLLHRAGTGDS